MCYATVESGNVFVPERSARRDARYGRICRAVTTRSSGKSCSTPTRTRVWGENTNLGPTLALFYVKVERCAEKSRLGVGWPRAYTELFVLGRAEIVFRSTTGYNSEGAPLC